jgi:hypothetical protein
MLTLHRGRSARPAERPRRSRLALAASLGVNAVLFGLFVDALTSHRWDHLIRRPAPALEERISYVPAPTVPRAQGPSIAGRSGGDGRPLAATPTRSRPLVAPRTVPSVVPPVTRGAPAPDVTGGTGPVVGAGGEGQGITPEYRDPALWTRPGTMAEAPKSRKQVVDSVLGQAFGRARDSILAVQEAQGKQRKPGDWTFKGPGGTWGMDDHSIHLGKIAVPNAVLALLSSKFQQNLRGNPVAAVEARRLGDVRRDLLEHAQASMNADDFKSAVKEIRARKDRERNERLAERRRAAELAAAQGDGGAGEAASPR